MPLVGASAVYRPPVAGEPLRLRDDGHWSTQGLGSFWPLNEMSGRTVADLSPNGNHGLNFRGPAQYVGNPHGGGLLLTAAREGVNCGTAGKLNGDFTISVWAQSTGDSGGLIVSRGATTNRGWELMRAYNNVLMRVSTDPTGWSFTDVSINYAWRLRETEHIHIAVTYAVGVGMTFYDNGVLKTLSTLVTDALRVSTLYCTIGARGAADPVFYGNLHHISLYDRALSADEIAALHAYPDLPLWRPRRGISLALVAVGGGVATYRPWLITGGRMR